MKCARCKKPKPPVAFCIDRGRRNGRNCWCKKCCRKYAQDHREKYLPGKRKSGRERHRKLRFEVLSHYSRGKPRCACCGIGILEFLGIDHINGGGVQHKRLVRHVYMWLRKNNFPKGFRVLCHNCNQSLGAYGYCPHDAKRRTESGRRGYRRSVGRNQRSGKRKNNMHGRTIPRDD